MIEKISFDFPGINLFSYLSFRAGCAILTSLVIVLIIGPKFIETMNSKQGKGQPIRVDGPKSHLFLKKGTPSMGGILILSSFFLSTLLWGDITNHFIWIVLLAGLLFGLIGYVDDRKKIKEQKSDGISSKNKFLFQVLSSFVLIFLITVFSSSEFIYSVSIPFINGVFFLGIILYYCFTSFVIVGTSNAVNLTDGLDGLLAGLLAICFAVFSAITYITGRVDFSDYLNILYIPGAGELTIFTSAMAGACIGYLWFNSHPAEIFMGDTGSLSTGAALGTLAVLLKKELLLLIIGGVFVWEAISVIIQLSYFRYTKSLSGEGKRFFKMAPIHHHYELKGWPETKVVIRFWIIGLLLALFSLTTFKIR